MLSGSFFHHSISFVIIGDMEMQETGREMTTKGLHITNSETAYNMGRCCASVSKLPQVLAME